MSDRSGPGKRAADRGPIGRGRRRQPTMTAVIVLAAVVVAGIGLTACGDGDGGILGGATTSSGVAPTTSSAIATTTSTIEATTTTSTSPETTTTTTAGFVQAEAEILLEPVGTAGPEAFTGEVFVEQTTTTSTTSTTSAATTTTATGPATVSALAGDTPALYGGSRDRARCDKEAQLRFLEQNPDKAAAFVAALNSDPELRWSGGTSLTVADLPDYFDELTPMVLTSDTRVTNHGFRNGQPTPRQSVLQAGTAVLVDAYGVPRVRCECGNPLIPPKPVPRTPEYTGPRWPDFDPDVIIVINPTVVIIDIFVLVDIFTGDVFVRPGGTDGSQDRPNEAAVWTIDVNVTRAETDWFNTTSVAWSGEFTIFDDGTVIGTGQGIWTFDGDCFAADGSIDSTSSASGTFRVNLVGQVGVGEFGRLVTIQPSYTGFGIGSYSGSPPDADCEQDIYEHVESWVAPAFAPLEELPLGGEPVLASYQSDGFIGDASFVPIG